MRTKYRYIPQHITRGHFITVRCEITADPSVAVRFPTPEDVLYFLNGRFGPSEPMDYKPVTLKITYSLEPETDESDHIKPKRDTLT